MLKKIKWIFTVIGGFGNPLIFVLRYILKIIFTKIKIGDKIRNTRAAGVGNNKNTPSGGNWVKIFYFFDFVIRKWSTLWTSIEKLLHKYIVIYAVSKKKYSLYVYATEIIRICFFESAVNPLNSGNCFSSFVHI